MVWSENFHFKPFPGQMRKERERERRALDAGEPRAQITPHPRRTAEIISSVVLDPKLIGAVVTDLVLVAHRCLRYQSRSHSRPKDHQRPRSRRLDLIAPMISSSSLFP